MAITINGSGTLSGVTAGLTAASMPTGSIVQTVTAEHSAETSTTGVAYVDTGLSASITPSSSSNKIMVIVSQYWHLERSTDQARGAIRLLRGSTVIEEGSNTADGSEGGALGFSSANGPGAIQITNRYNLVLLDSPSTTSATTYKTQMANHQTGSSPIMTINKNFNSNGQNAKGYITLMEVVA